MPKHELNDFQEAVLECLLDAQRERVGVISRDELLQRMQDTPGYDDCHHQRLAPSVKNLRRRGLLAEPRFGHFHITEAGDVALGHAMAGTVPADADSSVEEPFTVTGVDREPEPAPDPVTRVAPETRRVILPATKEEIDAANIAASRPGDYVDPGYHAGHGECLGGLHYPPGAESLQEGSALDDRAEYQDDHADDPPPPHVTTLMIAIHPASTNWLGHDATVVLKIDDEGAGPYLQIGGLDGSLQVDSLDTLNAIRNEGARLLREAQRGNG